MTNLEPLSKITGLDLADLKSLHQAFIHRSYLNESRDFKESNERLEFLGDSILSFITSNYLYRQFPDLPEGQLTNLRSSIVKTTTLAEVAGVSKLGDYLMLSKGEEDGGGRSNPSILADTFEAFLGALFLEKGLDYPRTILEKFLFPMLNEIIKTKKYKDSKSAFQEIIQEETKVSPLYKVLKEEGPDHAKEFTVGVFVDNVKRGSGKGRSKQEAEQAAAKQALEGWMKK